MIGSLLRTGNLIIVLFFFIGCKSHLEKKNIEQKKISISKNVISKKEKFLKSLIDIPDISFPSSSKAFDKCVKFDNVYFNIVDSCNFKKKEEILIFISDSISNTNKTNDFYTVNNNEKEYYPIFKFINDNHVIIGFFIEYWFEDKKSVSIQLNSFNLEGEQLDFLIVFNRFKFETLYKYDFEIDQGFDDIKVNIYTYNDILYDKKTGDILQGVNEVPEITSISEYYYINKEGFFQKK